MHILKRTTSNDHVPAALMDYDDTIGGVRLPSGEIVPGAEAYNDVIRRVGEFVTAFAGPEGAAEILRLQQEIDLVLAKTHGFNDKTRFAQSFRDAVDRYCAERGFLAPVGVRDGVFAIGMSVFTDYPYAALEGAAEVVNVLSQHYKMVLITKGAVDEQEKKLLQTGFLSAFDDVFVVGKKDQQDWQNILTALGHDPLYYGNSDPKITESWAIGNSAKADVNPLVAMGYNGIHIAEKNSWSFEAADLVMARPGRVCVRVTDITDVLKHVPPTY